MRGQVHTNTVEGYYSIFKRGMKGVYQHCARSTCTAILPSLIFATATASALGVEDQERAATALKGVTGKRLTYRAAPSLKNTAQKKSAIPRKGSAESPSCIIQEFSDLVECPLCVICQGIPERVDRSGGARPRRGVYGPPNNLIHTRVRFTST